jgi:hypothetical protein
MSQIRSQLRSQIGKQIRSQFDPAGGGGTGIFRYFIYLDPVLNSRYNTGWDLTSGDSFTIKYVAPTSTVTSRQWLFDSNTAGVDRNGLNMDVDGKFKTQGTYTFYLDGVPTQAGDLYPTDGKAHEIACEFTNSFSPSRFGTAYNNIDYYDGILFDLVVIISGATHTFPLDYPTATVAPSEEGGLFISIVNCPTTNRENYELNTNLIQWDNIDTEPQVLPPTIDLYTAEQRYFMEFDSVLNSDLMVDGGTFTDLLDGDTLEFSYLAPTGIVPALEHLFDADSDAAADRATLLMNTSGVWARSGYSDLWIDDVYIEPGASYPVDGKVHRVRVGFTSSIDKQVTRFGVRFSDTFYYNGFIYDIQFVKGGVTYTWPVAQSTGNTLTSQEGNATLSVTNIPDAQREPYNLRFDETDYGNVGADPQQLPGDIELYKIDRQFIQMDDVMDSYYNVTTAFVFGVNDELEFTYVAPTAVLPSREHMFDNDVSDAARCMLLMADDGTWSNSGDFDFYVDGVLKSGSSDYPVDGKQHHVRCVITTAGMRVVNFCTRYNVRDAYNGIMSNIKATIGGATTTFGVDLATGTAEASEEANNTLNYFNIPDSNREEFRRIMAEKEWNNISPDPQVLQTTIEII